MSSFRFEPAPQLLTPIDSYATLEVMDNGIVFARVELLPIGRRPRRRAML